MNININYKIKADSKNLRKIAKENDYNNWKDMMKDILTGVIEINLLEQFDDVKELDITIS